VTILKKQSHTDDKGWFSSLGVGCEATNPRHKNNLLIKCHKGPWNWKNSLDKYLNYGKWIRFGTCDVRSLYRACLLMTVVKEISNYNLNIVRVQEVRWDRDGTKPTGEYTFCMERRMRIMNYVQIFLYIRESYQQLRGQSLLVIGCHTHY
jgi:hypothetical protein